MLRRERAYWPLGSALALILLLTATGSARAGEARDTEKARRPSARQIIANVEKNKAGETWFGPHFHIKKGFGVAYSRPLQFRGRRLVLSIHGPAVKTAKKKKAGIGFEVRF